MTDLVATLREFDTGTLWECNQGGALAPGVRLLTAPTRVAGAALTVVCAPGDNLATHHAIAEATAGEILVVQSGDPDFGAWGEVMTEAAMARGIVGLVIDGSVRDLDAIRGLGFPVFARGTAIAGTVKHSPGAVRVPITCAGQLVMPGDIVVADESGVVAIRSADAQNVADKAAARRAKEARLIEQIRGGRTTVDLLGLQGKPS